MLKPAMCVLLGLVLLASAVPGAGGAAASERVWKLGFLDLSPPPADPREGNLAAFLQGMRELDYTEARHFTVEARYADAEFARVPRLAQELVDAGVDVIVTIGTPTAVAAKQATATIPIVMAGSQNPVEKGLIASFARPGGNVTGLTHQPGPEFPAKALSLLAQAVPAAQRPCVLSASDTPLALSGSVGTWSAVVVYNFGTVKNAAEFNATTQQISASTCDALYISPEFVFSKYRDELEAFLTHSRIPAMIQIRPLLETAGILYYYTDFDELRRRAAVYVDKILKGAKPADLPVEQPSKFEFIVNLKTARMLGLTIPQPLLALADLVIE